MEVIGTDISDLYLLEPRVHADNRGFFMESFNEKTLKNAGISFNVCQVNHSLSRSIHTLRGLHFQTEPKAQTKLVRVLIGRIIDVAVDLRKNSSTFTKWFATELSSENKRQLLIPKGFAHGFLTLEENTQVEYLVDEHYCAESDCGIIWNDPDIAIDWPTQTPILSEKDLKLKTLKEFG
jgi:dTDP-4-dehydrorhamnose 3,5-epimerase